MLTKRIVPCLDIHNGRVVKGRNFSGVRDVCCPVTLAEFYNSQGADELVFYDITASYENRQLFTDILKKIAGQIFIPLTVGGGIRTIEDFDRALKAGADKVSVNSGAIENPGLIREASRKYGAQCVVLSIDVKRVHGKFTVFSKGGRENTGMDAIQWAIDGEKSGAGELVINSIDTDGVKEGFDLALLTAITDKVSIPVVASGGAGGKKDFYNLFHTIPAVSAGLAASIFHFEEVTIPGLKHYLHHLEIPVRL